MCYTSGDGGLISLDTDLNLMSIKNRDLIFILFNAQRSQELVRNKSAGYCGLVVISDPIYSPLKVKIYL